MQRLEEIVRSLESDDIDLEKALSIFEEGVEHVRNAENVIRNAELKVDELLGPPGEHTTRPLEDMSE